MIGKMLEHASRRGDKKALAIINNKQQSTQLLWKEQKNPYYHQNEIFESFLEQNKAANKQHQSKGGRSPPTRKASTISISSRKSSQRRSQYSARTAATMGIE